MNKKIFVIVIIVIVAAVIVGGFFLVGSPQTARKQSADQQRVNDMQMIYYAVDSYFQQNTSLPSDLTVLQSDPKSYTANLNDPATGVPYEYRQLGDKQFELCAVFDFELVNTAGKTIPLENSGANFWQHSAGRSCYTLTVTNKP